MILTLIIQSNLENKYVNVKYITGKLIKKQIYIEYKSQIILINIV